MKKPVFHLLSILLFTSFLDVNCQNTTTKDSLLTKSYEELADLFYDNFNDTIKAKEIASSFFLKAKKENNIMEMVNGKYYEVQIKGEFKGFYNFSDSMITESKKRNNIELEMKIRCKKGETYHHNNLRKKSLNEFIKINKLLKKQKNDSINCIKNIYIGIAKSKEDFKEALFFYKKAFSYIKKNKKYSDNNSFLVVPTLIASSYSKMKHYDSAYVYLKKAENIFSSINDIHMLNGLYYSKALLEFKQKNYIKTIDNLKKTIHFFSDEDLNIRLLSSSYSIMAICYENLNNKVNALLYSKKVDSLYLKENIYTTNVEKNYTCLINFYKSKNDFKQQLIYINRLIEIKDKIYNDEKKITKSLTEEYDKPKLIAEKNAIIHQLERKASKDKIYKIVYLLLILGVLFVLVYQVKKKATYKKRFLKIVNQNTTDSHLTEKPTLNNTKNTASLPNSITNELIEKLTVFENDNAFLNSKINLKYVADSLDTNSNYLSKVVNQHKQLSFTNYINKLRVDYMVEKLKQDKQLRKYTIKSLAEEVGFKSAESFSKAFYKFTNLKPSYYIKELSKINN